MPPVSIEHHGKGALPGKEWRVAVSMEMQVKCRSHIQNIDKYSSKHARVNANKVTGGKVTWKKSGVLPRTAICVKPLRMKRKNKI